MSAETDHRCSAARPERPESLCVLPEIPHVDHVAADGFRWTDEEKVAEIRAATKARGTQRTRKSSLDALNDLRDRMKVEPDLPYGSPGEKNSGWSGSQTSKDRAEGQDGEGTTARRQQEVLTLLTQQGARGATWAEVASFLDVHHGSASGVLSVLHKVGKISRLSQTRDRSKVYVLPGFVEGRPVEEQGRSTSSPPS